MVQVFARRPYNVPDDAAPLWRGLAAYDDGDYEEARRRLTQALDDAPGLAHIYLGAIAAEADQWQDAAHHWSQARAAGIDAPRLHDNLGEVYHRLAEARLEGGDVSGARIAAEEAERFKDDDNQLNQLLAHIYHHRAYEAANRQDWDEAIDYWEMAEMQDGGNFRIAYNLALAHEKEEDYLTAAERWRETLRRKPRRDDHPDAMSDEQVARLWQRTAEAYARAGDFEEAAHVYNLAVKWQPENLTIRMARVESLLTDGRFQAAENELERILKRDPDYIPALLLRGDVEAQSGWGWFSTQRAAGYWERVLELDPDNEEAQQRLVDLYVDQAEEAQQWGFYHTEVVIELYERALSYRPQDGRVEAQIARTFLINGDPDEAQPYIERALAHNPADQQVYQDLIVGLFAAEEMDEAWTLMKEAEANVPDLSPIFRINLASNLVFNDKYDLARQWLDRAAETAPPQTPIYLIIGEMFMSIPPGTPDADELGIEYLQRAVDAGQSPGEAYFMMGVMAMKMGDQQQAKQYWRKAERIARKNRDDDLKERIAEARQMFLSPLGNLFSRMLGGGLSLPPDIFGSDFDDFEDDDDFYF
jgi:tetratricopeptide (TPR) repeat protein